MEPSQWNHILTLLAVTVVVDGRVYKEEVDTFVNEALGLKEKASPKMLFSKKMVFDWFVVHRDEIMKWLKEPNPQKRILQHILALGENPHRAKIMSAMYAIALADENYHKSEIDTLAMAAKHWGVPNPNRT